MFKFTVNYKDIQINNLLKNYNRTLKYKLPDILRDAFVDGYIMSGTKKVGSIWVTDGVVYVQFNEDYLKGLISSGSTTINGDFYVSARINLSKLPGDGKLTINTANKQYQFNFEEDAIAKYGQVTVDKQCTSPKVISNDSGDYLAYTIRVTAGQDGAPDVSIVDYFTTNSDLVSFVGITEQETSIINEENTMNPKETITDGKTHGSIYKGKVPTGNTIPSANDSNITEPGSLVWKIGDMSANETRSLTYYVKLKDNVALNGKAINNNAKLFSKSYFRQEDNAGFTPTIDYGGRMYKNNETPVRQEDGSYQIPYTLHFSISKDKSNYSLRNFVFWDYLDYSDNFHTDPTVRQYASYDKSSVKLFVKRDGASVFSEMSASDYTVNWSNGDVGSKPTRFSVTGTADHPLIVYPGDEYYVSYSLNVSNEAMAAMKSNSVKILNRFIADASNAKKYESYIDRVYDEVNVGNYNWNEKNVGNVTANDQTIIMDGNVYDSSFHLDSAPSFTVPSGSYPYTVKVNQTLGDWDATNITMKDTLTPADRMQYVGYVKIEACEYDSTENTYRTVETKWVNINGKSSFSIKPRDIGWSDNKYSYFITYYAHPVNQEQFSQATIKNSFTLEGDVTNGTSSHPITGIKSEKEVTVEGNYSMSVTKSSWYYEEPAVDSENWQNGKMYWVVEVNGSSIKEGMVFKDIVSKGDTKNGTVGMDSVLHEDSIAGIYKGTLEEGKYISSYKTLSDLKENSSLTSVRDKFDVLPLEKNTEISVQAKETIDLGTDKLYIVVMSEPSQIPANYREVYAYKNSIQTSDDGIQFTERGNATKDLCGGADILKEFGQTFTYSNGTVTSNNDGRDNGDSSKIIKDSLIGNGNYASWVFKVNFAGDLSGTYRVLDSIPDGMELAYMRIKWTGEKQGTIYAKEIDELDETWTKQEITAPTDNSGRIEKTVYYSNGKQALIKLGDFTAGHETDVYSVDVQVVCKVTDPNVLLGSETKTFVNQVELQTEEGYALKTATAQATISTKNIQKQITNKTNEKITFTIYTNPLGQTLPGGKNGTIKLIDKLSDTLILDITSLNAVVTGTNDEVQISVAVKDNNTLEIEIPDNQPVTITYCATVNVPPDTAVSFSNEAYWENYSHTSGETVNEEGYKYYAGGSVSSGTNIKLKIIKNDMNHATQFLKGAKFKMTECTRNGDGSFKEVETFTWTGSTDEKGLLNFGAGSRNDHVMDYNTVYKLVETEAPVGYVLDDTPVYFIVPKIENGKTEYSEYVKQCVADKNILKQYQSVFELTRSNHKGEITVEKKFIDQGGKDCSPVSGKYYFGLYDAEDKQLQTTSITYQASDTQTKSAKFVDLDLNTTYYVYELDDKGNKIQSAAVSTIHGLKYVTTYSPNANAAMNGQTITVTNQIFTPILPSTGSNGTVRYRIIGGTLILLAGLLMIKTLRKHNLEN
ncbi:MAG: SpaA isopeptide-forming pilin-related protein [Bulleidia sp.]|nr:SpaA isopeptide-forming pilin-related protein [Bulleidia sp.]